MKVQRPFSINSWLEAVRFSLIRMVRKEWTRDPYGAQGTQVNAGSVPGSIFWGSYGGIVLDWKNRHCKGEEKLGRQAWN